MSKWDQRTIEHETTMTIAVRQLADVTYAPTNLSGYISSGSFRTDGMVGIDWSSHHVASTTPRLKPGACGRTRPENADQESIELWIDVLGPSASGPD